MTELQLVLLVFAVIFVGALYWWGKRNKQQPIRRVHNEPLRAESPEEEGYEVEVVRRAGNAPTETDALASGAQSLAEEAVMPKPEQRTTAEASVQSRLMESQQDLMLEDTHQGQQALEARMAPVVDEPMAEEASHAPASEPVATEVFALLVLEPTGQFSREQIHQAMSACNMLLTERGVYVRRDAAGNTIFKAANVIEPGYFPPVEELGFMTPGLALVLELPGSISPYRAMDEFIHVARKASQSLGGKLYDAQRHLIRESELKSMREYAQSITR